MLTITELSFYEGNFRAHAQYLEEPIISQGNPLWSDVSLNVNVGHVDAVDS